MARKGTLSTFATACGGSTGIQLVKPSVANRGSRQTRRLWVPGIAQALRHRTHSAIDVRALAPGHPEARLPPRHALRRSHTAPYDSEGPRAWRPTLRSTMGRG